MERVDPDTDQDHDCALGGAVTGQQLRTRIRAFAAVLPESFHSPLTLPWAGGGS